MANINLLPWRETLREEKKREFITWIISAVLLGAIVSFIWSNIVMRDYRSQKQSNVYFKQETDKLNEKANVLGNLRKKRESLLSRVSVIQDLQGQRPKIVHVFDELTAIIPEGVYLKSFKRSGERLSITGAAEANSDVSGFLRNIGSSSWFSEPEFKHVKSSSDKQGEQINDFSLAVNILSPNAAALKKNKATK